LDLRSKISIGEKQSFSQTDNTIKIKNVNNYTILELVMYKKIINTMIKYINKLHNPDLLLSLVIFFDGIPSVSKIIEQRRRRIKNYLESNEKKNYLKNILIL
jgi:hypothetical protein